MTMRPASHRFATWLLMLAVVFSGYFFAPEAEAQTPRITHEIIKSTKKRQSMGRDLWFSMAENYELQQGGKYYELYVTSPAKTEVRVAIGKATEQKFPIAAREVLTFRIPLAWEMTSSGEVEDKAIHVWSEDADLTAYLLSRNPATSDGMYIIPSIGWGTEYVVSSFHSYAYLPGYELPSEFVLVANQDNTVIEITPSTDLRQGQTTAIAYPRGKKFSVTLQRGQAVQYQNSAANGQMEGYDVTGTILTGNKPFGVVAGNMCANIPAENPYCDHICDMLPPTRTWALTYYTAPLINRKGGDAFRVTAKEDNTIIYRQSAGSNDPQVFCILNKYEDYIRHDITEASKFFSDKPFMLMQYCNSTDFPDPGSNNGIGDPMMTIVNPVEQFSPTVIFQTPSISSGTAFTNYVNIIVHRDAVGTTKFDGKPLTSEANALPSVDGLYQVWRKNNVSKGTHVVESDSGVGVYVYGYGSYDSYGWAGSFGTNTFGSPDTIAPLAADVTQCFQAKIDFSDNHALAAKLSAVDLDSVYNMLYDIDPKWQPGVGIEKSFYNMEVIDQTKEAFLKITVFDAAGNTTTVISRYKPQIASINPPLTDFGVGQTGVETEQPWFPHR
jgi:adhesin/invasin